LADRKGNLKTAVDHFVLIHFLDEGFIFVSYLKIVTPLLLVFSVSLSAQQRSEHPTAIYISYSGFDSVKNIDLESAKLSLETFVFNTLVLSGGVTGFSTINELQEIREGQIVGDQVKGVVYEFKLGARVPIVKMSDMVGYYAQKRMDADYGLTPLNGRSHGLGLLSRTRISKYLSLFLGVEWAFEKEVSSSGMRRTTGKDYDLTATTFFNTAENLSIFTAVSLSPAGEEYAIGTAISF